MTTFKKTALALTAAAGLFQSTPSLAQEAPAGACELHIWPAERMAANTMGLLGAAGGVLGAVADSAAHANTNTNNRSQLSSALDSASQLEALNALDLREELKLAPGTTVIQHEEPLERKTMNKVKTRRADSASSCYSELIVADVLFTKTPIYGRSLKTLFMVREFGDDQTIDFEYKAWGGNGLKLFPPKKGEDALPALDELRETFVKNFQEYTNNARKAMQRRG